ncbi:AIP3-domain-containing protein [Ascobolus immersus RN42]|uniref:AIP3-domain-containing protein n=1 Tax=Ascobolus immersus RN42 TaxID=1160509 RepID=A0A3N4I6X5_ASCIM|nr:AIP3-domain-containing protein [Ascobolus immersus RN42]
MFISHFQGQISSIERSVTHLLVATKQLLETLTSWSRGMATENEVSDVYVRLGSEFNNACRSFMAIGIDTSDLGNVPDELRSILESTLSQQANPTSLEIFLPKIREIIINLLHGLKRKQSKLRVKREPLESRSRGSKRPGPSTSSDCNTADGGMISDAVISDEICNTLAQPSSGLPRSDVFVALQADHALERRASRRYSAFYGKDINKRSDSLMPRHNSGPSSSKRSVVSETGRAPSVAGNGDMPTIAQATPVTMPIGKDQQRGSHPNPSVLTLFLHMDGISKKVRVDASQVSSILSLVSLFSATFGIDFVDSNSRIWILDKHWGQRYVLEDLTDITDGSVLYNSDENSVSCQQESSALSQKLDGIYKTLQAISNRFDLERDTFLRINESCLSLINCSTGGRSYNTVGSPSGISLESYRRNLADMRVELANLKSSMKLPLQNIHDQLTDLRKKATLLKERTQSRIETGRSLINTGKARLLLESDRLVYKVDSIQDSIEELRKAILDNGKLPPSSTFQDISTELEQSRKEINQMADYIASEKPKWKHVWEFELERVCEDQQFCSMQEELAADLKDDLVKALRTFDLIRQCAMSPNNPKGKGGLMRSLRSTVVEEETVNILQEIRGISPDHKNRLAAIEKLEIRRDLQVKALAQGNGKYVIVEYFQANEVQV